jgi:hypothetical protein
VELVLITVFFAQWYRRSRTRALDTPASVGAAPGRIR